MDSAKILPPKDAPIRLWFDQTKKRWSKQIGGRRYRFGPAGCDYWTAYEDYLARFGGRPVDVRKVQQDGAISWLVDQWCNRQLRRCRSGEISPETWRDYQNIAMDIAEAVGHIPLLAVNGKTLRQLNAHHEPTVGPQRRKKLVLMLRRILHYGRQEKCLDIPSVGDWQGPSRKEIRDWRVQAEHLKNLTAAAIWDILEAAPSPMLRACIYLGINGGFSNSDVAHLKFQHLKQAGSVRFLAYPRPKTSIERLTPLWPETIEAIKVAIDDRVKPGPGHEDLVLLSTTGMPIDGTHLVGNRPTQITTLAKQWRYATRRAGRTEVGGFRRLRNTFATVAHGIADPIAVDYLMGHASKEMRKVYVGGAAWDRLTAVTDHVRQWFEAREDIAMLGPRPGDGAESVQTGWD